MYGVAGEKRPIFLESDAFSYNLDNPTYDAVHMVGSTTLVKKNDRYIGDRSVLLRHVYAKTG